MSRQLYSCCNCERIGALGEVVQHHGSLLELDRHARWSVECKHLLNLL